jgi:hypothetical protein
MPMFLFYNKYGKYLQKGDAYEKKSFDHWYHHGGGGK